MENTTTKLAKLAKIKIDKLSFKNLPSTSGVYLFYSSKKIIYIGKAINLKSRLSSYLNLNLGLKTKYMIKEAKYVTYIKVTSEFEALLLEAKLINKFKPHYNIISKDDKHPLYIIITKEEFPRVIASRVPTTYNLQLTTKYGPFPSSKNVKTILKMIRRVIPFSDHKIGSRPCIYSQIGLCNPCPSFAVHSTKNLVLRKRYRKNINYIKKLLEGRFSEVEKNLKLDMKKYSKEKKFEKAGEIRDKIKVLEYITRPQIPAEEFLKNPNLVDDIRKNEINSLKKLLSFYKINLKSLHRIECYDISHLSGVSATASMVVAIDGETKNSEYRHFKIKQKKTQSDFDSMKEVARRRIKNDWSKPDLIIVDGGLSQVKAFVEVFKKIPVVGISKNPDRLVFPDGKRVRLQGYSLQLVSRIRDEAHRFAQRYHHLLMKKNLLK